MPVSSRSGDVLQEKFQARDEARDPQLKFAILRSSVESPCAAESNCACRLWNSVQHSRRLSSGASINSVVHRRAFIIRSRH
jgi:hypothetical protein